jgi:hypothetical protein
MSGIGRQPGTFVKSVVFSADYRNDAAVCRTGNEDSPPAAEYTD